MSVDYSFKDYDKYLCIKPPAEFWLIVVYFFRPFILKISTIQVGKGGVKTDTVRGLFDVVYPSDFGYFLGILATIPVVFIIFALAKRKPDASDFVKKIWRNGVNLLMLAAVLNIILVFVPLVMGKIHSIHLLGWAQLAITALIIGYLLKSKHIKDAFSDFPVESEDEKNKGKKV